MLPSDIDVVLGKRLEARRKLFGMTQRQLGRAIGVTHQQIQRYECGAHKMSAVRLWQLSDALQVPVSYFYEGVDQSTGLPCEISEAMFAWKGARQLLNAYYQLGAEARSVLLEQARSLRGGE
ncbi:helix-turn-helix domain-containing protein [Patescibacteria group bacterium]|nr:helix-turn-helix domain-containing protein [Patescibacteria group bacterium]MBU1755206.1 helix-turn-helix domain-containing protein [Patescibacteria group bacterium]